MADQWEPKKILIAFFGKPVWRNGYINGGLGLFLIMAGMPDYKVAPTWGLYHLGSGHLICTMHADAQAVFSASAELAEAGDWSFDGLHGWRNQFPNVREKLHEF